MASSGVAGALDCVGTVEPNDLTPHEHSVSHEWLSHGLAVGGCELIVIGQLWQELLDPLGLQIDAVHEDE